MYDGAGRVRRGRRDCHFVHARAAGAPRAPRRAAV